MWYYRWLGYGIWGSGKKIGVDPLLPWYLEGVSDFAVGAAMAHPKTSPFTKRAATWTGQHVVRGSTWAYGSRAGLAVRGAVATTAMYTAAIGAGYVIGATVGVAISQAVWGDEGAQDALDLYSGNVSWDEYWTTVGNIFA